ncbi:hypothetical protein AAFF_G00049760 [Aldrovandia affinis]|uniref:Uncharacterized protein n=1 Tax=Aldrovandia affinis TaxID=143900 RepID=A0AAD7S1A3_9TELE|nr:hypothetical protein AAFF_G00049760 [Aldrovandia affinis]
MSQETLFSLSSPERRFPPPQQSAAFPHTAPRPQSGPRQTFPFLPFNVLSPDPGDGSVEQDVKPQSRGDAWGAGL